MKAGFVPGVPVQALLDAQAEVWRQAPSEAVALIGAPSALQPTAAVRAEFPDGRIGAVKQVAIAVLHNGSELAFRLTWQDPSADTGADGQDDVGFPDAAAILFPSRPHAPLMTMGAPGLPVTAWYWRADENGRGRQVTAEGLGTSQTVDRDQVFAQGVYGNGRWAVVIARALRAQSAGPVAQFETGAAANFSVAVWEGSHAERAGIKAISLGPLSGWHELVVDGRT